MNTRLKASMLAAALGLAATLAFGSEFAVEIGSYPTARLEVETPSVQLLNYDMLMYSQLSAKIDVFPWLYASGATTIYYYPYSQGLGFYPFYALFMVGAGVQFGPVTIGYEHRCDHAVVPYSFTADPLFRQDSGYDKVFLRYAVKF
jgi:hypothetical protein